MEAVPATVRLILVAAIVVRGDTSPKLCPASHRRGVDYNAQWNRSYGDVNIVGDFGGTNVVSDRVVNVCDHVWIACCALHGFFFKAFSSAA